MIEIDTHHCPPLPPPSPSTLRTCAHHTCAHLPSLVVLLWSIRGSVENSFLNSSKNFWQSSYGMSLSNPKRSSHNLLPLSTSSLSGLISPSYLPDMLLWIPSLICSSALLLFGVFCSACTHKAHLNASAAQRLIPMASHVSSCTIHCCIGHMHGLCPLGVLSNHVWFYRNIVFSLNTQCSHRSVTCSVSDHVT